VTIASSACASVIGLDDLHRDPSASSATSDGGANGANGSNGDPSSSGASSASGTVSVTGDPTCPGSAGPPSVRVTSSRGSFCIDATEVTNDDYAKFLAAPRATDFVPDICDGDSSLTPSNAWPAAAGAGRDPVGFVDWCDADAYCAWAGKALCAGLDGAPADAQDPTNSRWSLACGGASTRAFPYGDSYAPGTCNDSAPSGGIAAVASHAACVGGYAGLFDMSGNVAEWEDACTRSGKDFGQCAVRGGAFDSAPAGLACASRTLQSRTTTAANIGFRCCSQ
jgi:formylglycine-generating enzyme required for sulfatase activity